LSLASRSRRGRPFRVGSYVVVRDYTTTYSRIAGRVGSVDDRIRGGSSLRFRSGASRLLLCVRRRKETHDDCLTTTVQIKIANGIAHRTV
jgi:hypothetical protein